ncbi:response regulator receiver domain [Shimwellia blattae]|nr:response regulator receiver domain [Shimwellia blattae]VDY64663.1 Uncharacterised protein [Shimwellia blattae]
MSHVDNDSWQKHQSNAVKAFLKTAVVIDNQPWVKSSNRNVHLPISTDTGFGDENTFVLENPDVEISEHNEHDLNIRAISDVFAEKGIACAFVLPDDDAGEERDSKVNKVLQAAKISDLIVIDWYLERQSSSLTLEILEKIAKADDSDNGRLRLLCVYTGEPLGEEIFDEIKQYLKRGGVTVNDVSDIDYCAENASTIVILRNKTDTQAATLPDELIRLFTRFSNGLIPAFALASVGAIRDNTHHMLTRFGNWLDSSYIANKLITNPSSDVSEMLRDLFVTECDNALGLEKISDKYLSNDIIKHWVEANSDCIGDCQVNANYSINRDTILMLLDAGNITDKGFDLPNNSFF